MWKNWFETVLVDVNEEDGVIINFFGKITEMIFNILMIAGVPFLIYVFLQFMRNF